MAHQVEKHDDIDLEEWLAGLYIMLKGSRFTDQPVDMHIPLTRTSDTHQTSIKTRHPPEPNQTSVHASSAVHHDTCEKDEMSRLCTNSHVKVEQYYSNPQQIFSERSNLASVSLCMTFTMAATSPGRQKRPKFEPLNVGEQIHLQINS